MRNSMRLALFALVIANSVSAASITSDLSTVGTNGSGETVYRYTYNLEGLTPPLGLFQEVDIRFDPTVYKELSNGIAPAGFSVLLLQPNNPPGADGDFSIVALVNNPSMIGIFSVDFTLLAGAAPGVQSVYVNQLDDNGFFLNNVSSGLTAIPEPSPLWLGLSGFAASGLIRAASRRRR